MKYRVTFDTITDACTVDMIDSDTPIYIPAPGQTVILRDAAYVVLEVPAIAYDDTQDGERLQNATVGVVPLLET